jgi:pimeloyl-ACP methyl ester carboxylesterase
MNLVLPPAQCVATRQGAMACMQHGQGIPVLAIHGGMGACDQAWILGKALFADTARIIAVARPGYPGTPLSTGATPQAQADAYAALLDALGIDKAVAVSCSAGGPSSIQFALRHPDRCHGLILMSAATGPLQMPPRMLTQLNILAMLARVPGMTNYLRRRVTKDPLRAATRSLRDPATAAALLAHPVTGPLLRLFQQSIFTGLRQRIAGTRRDLALLATLPLLPLEQLAVPVLGLHSIDDPVVGVRHLDAVCAKAAKAQCVHLAKGGHIPLFTEMDAVRRHVAAFVSKL